MARSDPRPFIFRQYNSACFAWQKELLVMLLGFFREFAATCIAACDMQASLLPQSILPSRLLLSFEGTSLILYSDKKNHRKNHGEKIQPRRGCQKWEAPSHPQAAFFEEDERVPPGEICLAWASLTTLWSTHGQCQVEEEHY